MSDFLVKLLAPQRTTHVVDVGANPIDGDPPYKHMLAQSLCSVTGFEPQPDALAKLNRKKGSLETYLPYVIGRGGPAELKVCRYPGWTSLLQPRQAALQVFPQFQSNASVTSYVPVHTHRLDEVAELAPFDFLKIDVQGAELDVFEGARQHLQHAVAIQTEVSFVALYEGQPTFGVIDQTLRSMGFVPHCFAGVKNWPIAPLGMPQGEGAPPPHQLLEADVVYVKDFIDPVTMNSEQLKHLALLMHHCYASVDLVGRCIDLLQRQSAVPADTLQRYVDHLNQGSQLSASPTPHLPPEPEKLSQLNLEL
jgi:FkbM family methyltransferase